MVAPRGRSAESLCIGTSKGVVGPVAVIVPSPGGVIPARSATGHEAAGGSGGFVDRDCTDAANGGLPDFADQSVRLVGPWCDGGIAKHAIEFKLRDVVAFAGALLQRFVIEDRHVAAPVAD